MRLSGPVEAGIMVPLAFRRSLMPLACEKVIIPHIGGWGTGRVAGA